MVGIIAESLQGNTFLDTGTQRSKGLSLSLAHLNPIANWLVPADMLVTGIGFGASSYRNVGYEVNWDMYIDDTLIFSSVYFKEMEEYKRLRNPLLVKRGERVRFVVDNPDEVKIDVFFNVDYKNVSK